MVFMEGALSLGHFLPNKHESHWVKVLYVHSEWLHMKWYKSKTISFVTTDTEGKQLPLALTAESMNDSKVELVMFSFWSEAPLALEAIARIL